MKTTLQKLFGLGLILAGISTLVWVATGRSLDWSLLAQKTAHAAPPVVVSEAPVTRDVRLGTSFAPIVKRVAPSVVYVYSTKTVRNPYPQMMPFFNDPFFQQFFGNRFGPRRQPRTYKEQSLGSGVIVTRDGYILTNNHVVDGADDIKVMLPAGKRQFTAKVVGRDQKTDIAVLKVEAADLPYLVLGDSDKLEVGDVVLAIGNPFGIGQTVTMGIISALGRGNMDIEDYEDFIQTDAAINPGNSGGALVDVDGRLIGINTAILSRSGGNQGVGFAIPINLARNVMNQIIKTGHVERGFLGVRIQDLDPGLAKEFKVPSGQGALIGQVDENTAAATAGLKPGDVVIELNNKPVQDSRHLKLMVGEMAPGTQATLKVIRDGKEKTVTVTLKDMPGQQLTSNKSDGDDNADTGALNGVTVGDIDSAARGQFNIPADVRGALITNVDENSASYDAGLRAGDVIEEINRRPVRNGDEAVQISKQIRTKLVLVRLWSQGASHYVTVDESKTR
ncbi:MAG: DegQ family serine endoprotease [Verrucomicrobia bacterium]|nr:DegQ family serine endoprotease [Verrucomicrobiota bacterium]